MMSFDMQPELDQETRYKLAMGVGRAQTRISKRHGHDQTLITFVEYCRAISIGHAL